MPTQPVECLACNPPREFINKRALNMHVRQKHQVFDNIQRVDPELPHKNAADPLDRLSKEDLLALVRELVSRGPSGTVEDVSAISSEPVTVFTPKPPTQELDPAQLDLKERQQAAAAQRQAPATVNPVPGVEPGQYVVTGHDKSGNPSFAKVRHTREYIEKKYDMVEFEPHISKRVTVWGNTWNLIGRQPNRVPSIVRDIYYEHLRAIDLENRRYPILSSEEERQITQGAIENKMAWSRMFKASAGWMPEDMESGAPQAPATPES